MTNNVSTNRKSLEKLSWVLDQSIRLPGGYKIGLDGFLGLIPVWGDAAGLLISGCILLYALKIGAPIPVLIRMITNIFIDTMIGLVPLFGDIFDFAWKANEKNIQLINRYQDDSDQVSRENRCLFIAAALGLALMSFCVLWVGAHLMEAILNLFK